MWSQIRTLMEKNANLENTKRSLEDQLDRVSLFYYSIKVTVSWIELLSKYLMYMIKFTVVLLHIFRISYFDCSKYADEARLLLELA